MDAITFLKTIPAYKNSAFRSLCKRAQFFANILFCRVLRINRPLWVILVTNNGCNLSCSYCYGCYGESRKVQDYSTQELIDIIDELWLLGTRNLTVHGGESLLRKDIGLLFNYMKHKGFYVSLNTNGTFVPQMIDQLRCIDCICVSLDGRQEINDKHRGKGSYTMAVEAMKVIVKNNIPLVIHATLTRDNMNDMEYLCDLTRQMKGRLQFSILYNADKFTDTETVMDDSQTRTVLREILRLKKSGYPIYYSTRTLEAAIDWPFSYDDKFYTIEGDNVSDYKKRVRCFHGFLKYYLDADGKVLTCWRHNHADAPNLRKLGVKKAIDECHKINSCKYCPFLSNNEHNAIFCLIPGSTLDMVRLQIQDALKIIRK